MKPVVPPFVRGEGFGTLGQSFAEPTLPQAVPLQPATVGAWTTLGLFALLGLGLLAFAVQAHRRRRHRRTARRELIRLERLWSESAPGSSERKEPLERLPVIVKACALGSFRRGEVARLAGADWIEFLNRSSPKRPFSGPMGETLSSLCIRGSGALRRRTGAATLCGRSILGREPPRAA